MKSLIKYGLYFVVPFSVLAFGAAEVWAFSIVEFVVFLLLFLFVAGSWSGLTRKFLARGAAVWIPAALFVLLVLFQMVPLPAGVLKVVSPATYELYDRSFWNNHYAGMLE